MTGPLTFLPFHAAAFNSVVSSYTPSLSILLQSQFSSVDSQRQSADPNIVVISQPATPLQHPLPGAVHEVTTIRSHIPHNITVLSDKTATVSAVFEEMDKHSWAHFACHGVQNLHDATTSAFALHDGQLQLSQIMTKSFKHAQFAFLSACQTAAGDKDLPDEAVHLAAGMLAMGYRGVVGTMWSIRDADAPFVTDKFYASLINYLKNCNGNHSHPRAAYALHDAISSLREKLGEEEFLRWVPFIHFGV
jgi:CHAT domain-containing protein